MTGRRVARAWLPIALGALVAGPAVAQTISEQLRPTLDLLGDFDHAVRMEASRTVRRAPPEVRDAFDMLDEDFTEERFYVLTRNTRRE